MRKDFDTTYCYDITS